MVTLSVCTKLCTASSTFHVTHSLLPPPVLGFDRGNTLKIHHQRCLTRRRQHAFSVRVVSTGTSCQRILRPLQSWRHSNFDWTHNGSPSSQKFPSNLSPNTPSRICTTLSYPALCYQCSYSWSSIIVLTAH